MLKEQVTVFIVLVSLKIDSGKIETAKKAIRLKWESSKIVDVGEC